MAEEPKSKYNSDIENALATMVVDHEYKTAKSNNDEEYSDYESLLDKVENIRSEKNYDWQSDIALGVFTSHLLTEASGWVSQYFATRDFVEVYLEGESNDDIRKCEAAKKCINKSLNIKDIYHYHKYVRARSINWSFGQVWAMCWWEKEVREETVERPPLTTIVPVYDEIGNVVGRKIEVPQAPKKYKHIIKDRFNWDVLDPRNVYTDYSYSYSAQLKDWIIVRTEKTFDEIEDAADQMQYFNLDILKEHVIKYSGETETASETYNKYGWKSPFTRTPLKPFDIIDRYGKIWAIVEERDEEGNPSKINPIENQDEPEEKAELVEAIVTFALVGDVKVLIGFKPTWAIDANGKPYKPLIRGWCYIHPSKDTGLSDGKNLREIDTAINDTFNISNDRVMLATLPVLMGRKLALDDNPTVFIQPENVIKLEDIDKDLKELTIRDNIAGAMTQLQVLKGHASELDSIYPPQMGGIVGRSSVTATETMGAETNANARQSYKSMTVEYTFLCPLYDMILNMTYRFAEPETLIKLVGKELAMFFSPSDDYTYVPLSQSIEAEHNKMKKVGVYDQMMGRLAGLAKVSPQGIIPIIAYIIGKQATLLGSEYQEIAGLLKNLVKSPITQEGQGAESTSDMPPEPLSNQQGVPMSGMEQSARGMGNMAGGNFAGLMY